MGDVVYTAQVRIERREGPLRAAFLPAETEPVFYGVHGAIAATRSGSGYTGYAEGPAL
jgi:hypothetical protein